MFDARRLPMLLKFLRLALSRPILTLRLAHPRRVRNAIVFFHSNRGNLDQLYSRYEQIYGRGRDKQLSVALVNAECRKQVKNNVLIFPLIDWEFRQQRPQHLALNLGKLGYRVLYFSMSPLMDADGPPYRIVAQPGENVFVCRLRSGHVQIADLNGDQMNQSELEGYLAALRVLMGDLNMAAPIVILNHPYWTPLARKLPASRLGYDCMDHHQGFRVKVPSRLVKAEEVLIKTADFVVTSSTYLQRRIGSIRDSVLIRNGCEYTLFSQVPAPPRGTTPVAGYIGAIAEWFDMKLVIEVAKTLPHWQFVLVGSTVGCDLREARQLANIEFVGEVSYSSVPLHLARFDVCMIPFLVTDLTEATNPVKVYEYLASGRPVVATPIPEVELLGDKTKVAADAQAFAAKLQESLGIDRSVLEERRRWAAAQDWSVRAITLERAMLPT